MILGDPWKERAERHNHGLELIYIVCVNIVLSRYMLFDGWVTSSWRTGRVGYGIVYFRSVSSDRIGYISLRTENRQKTAALSIGYFGVETSVFKASRIEFEKECSELTWKHRLGCPGPNLLHPQPHTWLGAGPHRPLVFEKPIPTEVYDGWHRVANESILDYVCHDSRDAQQWKH